MKTSACHQELIDLSTISFHPELTFRCKAKRVIQGAWYFVLTLLFFCGLPALAVWFMDAVSKALDSQL
jgi:hypothetical protein